MNLVSISSLRRVWILALVMALAVVASPDAQRPQGGSAPAGGLTIDFVATTADGKPAADLTPADVTVRLGGKVRAVASLVMKKVDASGAPAAEAEADTASPPFATNDAVAAAAGSPGRSFIIIVDTDSMVAGTEPQVRTAIEGLLKQLNANDRVAFSIAPRDTAAVGFGGGIAKVRDAVAAMKAQRSPNATTADNLCRTRDTLNMVQSMVETLAGNETPTAVVVIAAALSVPGQASSQTAGTCSVTNDQYQTITTAAAAGRANMYVVQADAGALGRNDGLDNLAGETGAGAVLRVVNEGFAPKVLADASTYWVATLAPDPGDRPGQSQQLEVRATREGVTAKARPRAFISKPGAGAPGAAGGAAAAKPGTVSPRDMIRTAAKFTDLQLRATAYAARGAADKMNVLVIAEPVDPTVKIKEMSVGFFDQAGQGGSTAAPQVATYPITTVLPLGSGQYRIRVAAVDTNGKSGAVDVSLNTTLVTAGTLKISQLLFVAPNEKGALAPRLLYSNEDKVTVVLEMYGTPTAAVSAKFELAKTDIGAALKTLQPTGGGPTNEPDKFQIVGEIPLKDLEPGDYVVRVLVQMEGQPEGRVSKTFRKVAK